MLNWTTTEHLNTTLHSTSVIESDDQTIRTSIEFCADKAISLLTHNIQDDSLYLLFEWNTKLAKLSIVVTDATKQSEAPESVSCTFPNLTETLHQETVTALTDNVKFWLHDYLTTCTAFFSYSLVAIFHSSNRNNTELL